MEQFNLEDFDPPSDITSEFVLDQVDDLLIYRYYLGPFKLGTSIKSPFRRDSNPSFSITLNSTWLKLMWKDFGTGDFGDCFKLVSKLYNISYRDAIEKIANDFGLVKGNSIVSKKDILEARQFKEEFQKKEYLIQVERRKMNQEELDYWKSYNISKEELLENYIYSINKLWINKKSMNLDVSHLHFAYYFPKEDKWKIYSPTDKEHKWFGNIPISTMEGIPDLIPNSKAVIITKSRKDRIILKKLYTHVYSCQNESEQAISRDMDVLLDSNFDNKYCWFDSDEPGKTANRKLNHRGYKWINVPNSLYDKFKVKDPSDVIKQFGWEIGKDILLTELNKKGII